MAQRRVNITSEPGVREAKADAILTIALSWHSIAADIVDKARVALAVPKATGRSLEPLVRFRHGVHAGASGVRARAAFAGSAGQAAPLCLARDDAASGTDVLERYDVWRHAVEPVGKVLSCTDFKGLRYDWNLRSSRFVFGFVFFVCFLV